MSRLKSGLTAAVFAASLMALSGTVVAQDDGPSPSPASSAGPGWLGATEEAYSEPFDVAPEWLDLGEDEGGRTAVEDGHVYMSVIGPEANYWDAVVLPGAAGVMRVEATVELDGSASTAAGPACGSAVGLPRWFVAGVNGDDEWWLGRLIDGRLQVVDRGNLIVGSPSRSAVRVAIECVTAPSEGGDYVLITVDDQLVAVSMPVLDIPVGPFDKAGLLVGTDGEEGSATFDDLVVHTGQTLARRPANRDPDKPST